MTWNGWKSILYTIRVLPFFGYDLEWLEKRFIYHIRVLSFYKTRIWLGMARKAFYIPYPRFIHLDKTRIWLGKHVSQEFMISVRPLLIRPSVSAFYPNPTAISVISGTGMNLISNAASLMIFFALFLPLFIFVDFKLLIIARKVQRERTVLPERELQ